MPAPPERTRRKRDQAHGQFPPLSISLDTFLRDGSDTEFRNMIYNVLSVSALMLGARAHFAAHIGVTPPQYSMMMAIGEAGRQTIGRIAARLHVTGPFVTTEVGKLLRRGLVKKTPNLADGRSSLLELTEQGAELIRAVGPVRCRANDVIFGSLSREQARQLEEIMARLAIDTQRAVHELEGLRKAPQTPE